MKKNNYDKSSTGYHCELIVMLDHDVSRMNFEEEFHIHQHDGYAQTCVLQFGIHEVEPVERCTDLFEFSDDITEKEYRNALYRMKRDEWSTYLRPSPYSPRDFFSEYGVGDVDWKEAFMNELDSYDIAEYAKEGSLSLIDELETGVIHRFRIIASQGHSQGDYALVLIPNEHGWDGEYKDAIDEGIGNALWSSPIYARLEFTTDDGDHEEIFINEWMEDRYDWDRDKVLDALKRMGTPEQEGLMTRDEPLPDEVIKFVEENLPEYPES